MTTLSNIPTHVNIDFEGVDVTLSNVIIKRHRRLKTSLYLEVRIDEFTEDPYIELNCVNNILSDTDVISLSFEHLQHVGIALKEDDIKSRRLITEVSKVWTLDTFLFSITKTSKEKMKLRYSDDFIPNIDKLTGIKITPVTKELT